MTHLLDTSTCLGHLRTPGSVPVRNRLAAMRRGDVALCSVVKAELLYGAYRSNDLAKNLAQLSGFFARFTSLPFDDAAAQAYGEIRAALARSGKPIGPNDLMIAAIAVANGLVLVTHNTSEFSRVPNLRIEDWETTP